MVHKVQVDPEGRRAFSNRFGVGNDLLVIGVDLHKGGDAIIGFGFSELMGVALLLLVSRECELFHSDLLFTILPRIALEHRDLSEGEVLELTDELKLFSQVTGRRALSSHI